METKTYQTAKEFFKYLNNYEADIWIRGSKAYNVNGELKAEYNGSCMISWGLRGDSLSKYTELRARKYAENLTEPQLIIHIVSHSFYLN